MITKKRIVEIRFLDDEEPPYGKDNPDGFYYLPKQETLYMCFDGAFIHSWDIGNAYVDKLVSPEVLLGDSDD